MHDAPPTPTELLAAALEYAALGWPVVPLHHVTLAPGEPPRCSCGRACDNSRGKHPWPSEWQRAATTNPDVIRRWWRDRPRSNVGIRTGFPLVAVDVDPPGGEAALAALSGGDLPDTLEVVTGKGRRLLYEVPDALEAVPVTVPFKDHRDQEAVRLQGGNSGAQCVLPPSLHWSGRRYRWAPGRSPKDLAPAPMPTWMIALMCPAPARWDPQSNRSTGGDATPWSEFNARGVWLEILQGAKPCGRRGAVEYVTRPGKAGGVSASIGHHRAKDDSPALHVFTSNWPGLEADRTYDKFGAFARLYHRGDFAAATKDLLARGFGTARKNQTAEERIASLEKKVYAMLKIIKGLMAERNTERGRSS